ncbi:MAG: hypothetical protein TEF_11930 [Rhizobiales bacterium NRL2]|jgi:D-alanyl-lipoteichoic acid acyltransferase DltB (MBOAT superfamily)|nr:MAG: hypothetical protein TEF_11930 [Rhizobiales bacterium NRL2]
MGPFSFWHWLVVAIIAGGLAGYVLLRSADRIRGRSRPDGGAGMRWTWFRVPGLICLAIAGLGVVAGAVLLIHDHMGAA